MAGVPIQGYKGCSTDLDRILIYFLPTSLSSGVLLTSSNARSPKYPDSIFIDRDLVRDQLQAVDGKIGLNRDQGKWFARCSVCNSVLSKPDRAAAPEHVPDFVSFSYPHQVRFCPSQAILLAGNPP